MVMPLYKPHSTKLLMIRLRPTIRCSAPGYQKSIPLGLVIIREDKP